jgi:hypothetical protein
LLVTGAVGVEFEERRRAPGICADRIGLQTPGAHTFHIDRPVDEPGAWRAAAFVAAWASYATVQLPASRRSVNCVYVNLEGRGLGAEGQA